MEEKYNTNLASEFYVMSILYRKGVDAYLTFGNKKGVDILIKNILGNTLKIEVKGVNSKSNDWPLSSNELISSKDLFFILISYESKIHDLTFAPRIWIIPSAVLKAKCKHSPLKSGKKMSYMSHKVVREKFMEYENNWSLLEK